MSPLTKTIDLASGTIPDAAEVQTRTLRDLQGLFADTEAENALFAESPIIYRVYLAADIPAEEGQLGYSTTVIYPGTVGGEYFMTKGHYHALANRAEVYTCLKGRGALLLQTPEGKTSVQHMTPGTAAYVPPFWGHRTMNTGTEPFAFMAVYPADAGYDYTTIAERGFAALIVERGGRPEVVPNPRYRP
jgi:glucose-6-phosphate isomerase